MCRPKLVYLTWIKQSMIVCVGLSSKIIVHRPQFVKGRQLPQCQAQLWLWTWRQVLFVARLSVEVELLLHVSVGMCSLPDLQIIVFKSVRQPSWRYAVKGMAAIVVSPVFSLQAQLLESLFQKMHSTMLLYRPSSWPATCWSRDAELHWNSWSRHIQRSVIPASSQLCSSQSLHACLPDLYPATLTAKGIWNIAYWIWLCSKRAWQ